MLDVNQHLNNVVLPVGEHHTLSIAQYSVTGHVEALKNFDDFVEELSK